MRINEGVFIDCRLSEDSSSKESTRYRGLRTEDFRAVEHDSTPLFDSHGVIKSSGHRGSGQRAGGGHLLALRLCNGSGLELDLDEVRLYETLSG